MSFINSAFAAGTNSLMPTNSNGTGSLIMMLVLFFVVSYFVLWRPQSKRAKEHRDLMTNLSKGDEVVTTGGLLGKLTKVDDSFAVLSISENVEIKIQKSAIAAVLPKGTLKSI